MDKSTIAFVVLCLVAGGILYDQMQDGANTPSRLTLLPSVRTTVLRPDGPAGTPRSGPGSSRFLRVAD